jgi:hypothetical protein
MTARRTPARARSFSREPLAQVIHRVAHQACFEGFVSLADQKSFVTGHRRTRSNSLQVLEETRPSGLVEDSLEFVGQSSREAAEASEQRFEFRASESRQPGEQVTQRVSPKGVRSGSSIHRDNCLVPDVRARPADESSRIWPRRVMASRKAHRVFRPRPFGLKSSCLLMCSFSQNGPIFVKFPAIFL